jgi:plasmid maintenance system antidote protein VapI
MSTGARVPARVIQFGEWGFYRHLARELKVSQNYVHRVLVRKDRIPSAALARRMARVMGISVDEFWRRLEKGKRRKAA